MWPVTKLKKVAWYDPWLLVAVGVGSSLRISRLGDYDNPYYTATVASMLQGVHNFLFASFDPVGVVMVDKPPASLWLQTLPGALFGVNTWSVTLPQVVMGITAIAIVYWIVGSIYGRMAGIIAALVLAVLPASVVIDSRNEPDAIVSFTLLLSAFAITRAVQTGRYRWYLAFAALMGLAFNAKMFVAFVPLPAFLVFSVMASSLPLKKMIRRIGLTLILLLAVTLLWVTLVAVTPQDRRPYVGSTEDNSIWTLLFEYNGLQRFTSFIGPKRPPAAIQPFPPQQGQNLIGLDGSNQAALYQPARPMPITGEAESSGLIGLFNDPLANQLGWLLPMGVVALALVCMPMIPDEVFRRPASLPSVLRANPQASHAILWSGWLLTGLVVFGTANATTTHPYYLVGVAVPLAAVIGIGCAALLVHFRKGNWLSWLTIVFLLLASAYQLYGSRGYVGDLEASVVIILTLCCIGLMGTALKRGLQSEPMASMSFVVSIVCLLIIPVSVALNTAGRLAGPPVAGPPVSRPARAASFTASDESQLALLIEYLNRRAQPELSNILLTVNAREAAPFILGGVRTVAIGGFSGNDPVFTLESFKKKMLHLRKIYFLMPTERGQVRANRGIQQEPIVNHVRAEWDDISLDAGLPRGTLYEKPNKREISGEKSANMQHAEIS